MTPSNSTSAAPATVRTTKSGIDLNSFNDVKMYKDLPKLPAVTSIEDALARINHDKEKLLTLLSAALQAEAVESARTSEDGWLLFDDNGAPTSEAFAGTLIAKDVLNPVVLNLARINSTPVIRGGKTVEITWDEAENGVEKRAVKESTLEMIRTTPKIVEGLKRKMAATNAAE